MCGKFPYLAFEVFKGLAYLLVGHPGIGHVNYRAENQVSCNVKRGNDKPDDPPAFLTEESLKHHAGSLYFCLIHEPLVCTRVSPDHADKSSFQFTP